MPESCDLPSQNATSDEVRDILKTARTIAVVGLSDKPDRDSHHVAAYLQQHGYRIIPVNPNAQEILGERCYPSLREIPVPVELVDIFRRADAVPAIVEEALAIGAKVVWMQLGVINEQAATRAKAAGLQVVMDACVKIEHARFFGGLNTVGLNTGVISSKPIAR